MQMHKACGGECEERVTIDAALGTADFALPNIVVIGMMKAGTTAGAVGALNLDGGGSTTMWVRGEGVVSRPSNAGRRQRPVGAALLVLPGRDTGIPSALR
jgi:exopolysaccharide biosynthesis protein